MHFIKEVSKDIFWVGVSDRRLALFENVFPVPRGVSYNSYLLLDEKTVLFDTVDKSVNGVFFENIQFLLKERKLDYLVINHIEPDHCASLCELLVHYPKLKIISNQKAAVMLQQFFDFSVINYDFDANFICVKEGDTFECGKHTLNFIMTPMVHWPETMMTYESSGGVLFSADAFGTFGALGGNIFADELDFKHEWLPDARRYYTNIVGKYGPPVCAALAKVEKLTISTVCPLHGPVWRKDFSWYLEKYQRWGTYTPEETAVMIAYGSVYGGTENAANVLAGLLAEKGIRNIKIYDVSVTHPSEILAEAFRCSHLVFASATYNAGIFCNMETLLLDLKAHNLQNRKVALIENGTWAPQSGKLMHDIFQSMKDITILDTTFTIKSQLRQNDLTALEKLAGVIYQSISSC